MEDKTVVLEVRELREVVEARQEAADIADSMGYGAVARAILARGEPAKLEALLEKRAKTLEAASPRQANVLCAIISERERQDRLFPDEHPADGTPFPFAVEVVVAMKAMGHMVKANGKETWARILIEEVAEALQEGSRGALRTELVEVAAVAVNWIEAIDRG